MIVALLIVVLALPLLLSAPDLLRARRRPSGLIYRTAGR
ncbi:MAG: hypothetical protein QOJ63_1208 [Solirubrobacteraceae bacterium]|nr:hypothetical protein [Solirubrobacteraceae bacterium]